MSWNAKKVAEGQRELVLKELQRPLHEIPPYKQLVTVLRAEFPEQFLFGQGIEGFSICDIGCGVGHYGEVLHRELGDICWSGYDASPEMIVATVKKNNCMDSLPCVWDIEQPEDLENIPDTMVFADVILMSGLLEFLVNPGKTIETWMSCFKEEADPYHPKDRTFIIHRIRTDLPVGHAETEMVYGEPAPRVGLSPGLVAGWFIDGIEKAGWKLNAVHVYRYDKDKYTVVIKTRG